MHAEIYAKCSFPSDGDSGLRHQRHFAQVLDLTQKSPKISQNQALSVYALPRINTRPHGVLTCFTATIPRQLRISRKSQERSMAYIRAVKGGFRVECVRKGQRKSATFETKREAIDWGKRTDIQLLEVAADDSHTFSDAAAKYLKDVSPKKDGAKWEALRLARMVEYFGDIRLADIKAPQIAAWRDARLAGDADHRAVSGSTVVRESNLLRNVFSIARDEWHWMEHSPFKGVKLPDEADPRHQRWGWKAIKRVLRRLGHVTGRKPTTNGQQAALAFLITLSTSLRASECLRVGPSTFDKSRKVIAVKAKGKRRVEIPVPRRALKHCALADFTINAKDLDVTFRDARDACMVGDFTFHDGRASALTWLARRVDVLTLSRISQHSDLRILQRVYYRESAAEIAARL